MTTFTSNGLRTLPHAERALSRKHVNQNILARAAFFVLIALGVLIMPNGYTSLQAQVDSQTTSPSKSTQGSSTQAQSAQVNDAKELIRVGMKAPPITSSYWMNEATDTAITFNDGKVHVLAFTAYWCGPCVFMYKPLGEIFEQYTDKVRVTFITPLAGIHKGRGGLSRDEESRLLREYFAEKAVRTPIVMGGRSPHPRAKVGAPAVSTEAAYDAASYPLLFVVDQQGVVQQAWRGWEFDQSVREIKNLIAKLLGESVVDSTRSGSTFEDLLRTMIELSKPTGDSIVDSTKKK